MRSRRPRGSFDPWRSPLVWKGLSIQAEGNICGSPEGRDKPLGDVLDGDGLKARLAAAQYRPHGGPPHEPRQHRDELIARAVDERRAEYGPLERAGAHDLLGLPLRLMIARARIGPGPKRAHVDVALDPGLVGDAQHIGGGQRMEALEGDPARPVLADDAHEVDDGRASFHGVDEALGLEHVSGYPIDGFESAQPRLRASADKAANKKAVLEERAYHRVAHEAGGAGDEDALHQGRIVARGRPIFSSDAAPGPLS